MINKKIVFGKGKQNYCEVDIIIQETDKTYNIEYKYKFGNESKINHPFYKFPSFVNHSSGDIIAKNELTDTLVKYLLMDFDTLKIYSGHTCPEHYKSIIMVQIAMLWD